jgi:DnaK suppressor protein
LREQKGISDRKLGPAEAFMKYTFSTVDRWSGEEVMTADFELFRRRLETERERLSKELKTTASLVIRRREQGSYGEYGELSSDIVEIERSLTLEKRIRNQLAEVEHALQKFHKGNYGLCDICGQPIEPARLEALPQASLCLNCKAHLSKGGMRAGRND